MTRIVNPSDSRITLTHTNDEVRELNLAARERLRAGGGLGEDISIGVERGQRNFATGERVMFLRNDRDLGVKNGSLGTVEHLNKQTMTVRLDDGRSAAFDLKDYDQIDHGYAATIHKSQGITVDRTHVLATPGMDQHSSYVALSRHRDGVQIHYGRDDFADDARLARTLARDRAKDMASDYGRDEGMEQRFAERRGITFRQRVAEVFRKVVPGRVRELFGGLDQASTGRQIGDAPAPERADPETDLRHARRFAVERHARAVTAIFALQDDGMKPGHDALSELRAARQDLNGQREHASYDMEAAYKRDPTLAHKAAGGKIDRAVKAMIDETGDRTNTNSRANRFVTRWQQLEQESGLSYERGDMKHFKTARSSMADLAKSLERDPQLESALANRKADLGIAFTSGRSLGHELAFNHGLDIGIGRGIGI